MRLRWMLAAAAVGALAAAGSAIAADLGEKLASGTNRGAFVVARAHGSVKKPSAMFVKVTSRPHLKVAGSYVDDCTNKFGTGGTKGDRFHGRAPLVEKLKHQLAHPASCEITAAAQLGGQGRIRIALYARTAG
jgi:hypothetical protein